MFFGKFWKGAGTAKKHKTHPAVEHQPGPKKPVKASPPPAPQKAKRRRPPEPTAVFVQCRFTRRLWPIYNPAGVDAFDVFTSRRRSWTMARGVLTVYDRNHAR